MTPDTPADGEALASSESVFMDVVWDALKADTNDLRKQQRILRAFRAALIPRPAEPAQAAQVEANQRRADAATLLLDMLYMRNGAHEGLDRDAVEKMWNAVREDDGFPSVVQFLSVIAAAQEGRE